jgi:hypothetical protein
MILYAMSLTGFAISALLICIMAGIYARPGIEDDRPG